MSLWDLARKLLKVGIGDQNRANPPFSKEARGFFKEIFAKDSIHAKFRIVMFFYMSILKHAHLLLKFEFVDQRGIILTFGLVFFTSSM